MDRKEIPREEEAKNLKTQLRTRMKKLKGKKVKKVSLDVFFCTLC